MTTPRKPMSAETKAKISAANKGKVKTPEHLAKISEALTGREFSPEHRKAISDAQKGKPGNHFGHRHSDETKAKIAESNRRRTRDQTRWKEDASTTAIHMYLRKYHPMTGICERCKSEVGTTKGNGTQMAFKYHPYPWTRDREDYEELCRKCHGSDHPRAKSFSPRIPPWASRGISDDHTESN